MEQYEVDLLRAFVNTIKQDPDIIHLPELGFFKDYVAR